MKLIAIPDDGKEYVLVPREPTKEMMQAAQASEIEGYHGDYLVADDCYAAMLSAAPPVKVFELPGRRRNHTILTDGSTVIHNSYAIPWNDLLDEIERRAKG